MGPSPMRSGGFIASTDADWYYRDGTTIVAAQDHVPLALRDLDSARLRCAVSTVGGRCERLVLWNFNLALPDAAAITRIDVSLTAASTAGNGRVKEISLRKNATTTIETRILDQTIPINSGTEFQTITTQFSPTGLVGADLNDPGDLTYSSRDFGFELVVGAAANTTDTVEINLAAVTVYYSQDGLTFVLQAELDPGTNSKPSAAAVFDVDGDGDQDVVLDNSMGERSLNQFFIARQDSGLVFTMLADDIPPASSSYDHIPNGLGLHDFNNDGKLDVFLANNGRGTAAATASPPTSYLVLDGYNQSSEHSVQINASSSSGIVFNTIDIGLNSMGQTRTVLFADFDGDGFFDSYHPKSPYYGVWHVNGDEANELRKGLGWQGGYQRYNTELLEPYFATYFPDVSVFRDGRKRAIVDFKATVIRDFNGDDKPDIISGAHSDATCGLYCVNGAVQQAADGNIDIHNETTDSAGQDGIGDGGYQNAWTRGLYIFQNTSMPGAISFIDRSHARTDHIGYSDGTAGYSQMHIYSVVPFDMDSDGDLDLWVNGKKGPAIDKTDGTYDADIIRVLRNDSAIGGDIVFTDITTTLPQVQALNDAVADDFAYDWLPNLAAGVPIDYDNDGDVDIMNIDRRDGAATMLRPYLWRNDSNPYNVPPGTLGFTRVTVASHGFAGKYNDVITGDLNNDGKLDLVATASSKAMINGLPKVFLNQDPSTNNWIKLKVTAPDNLLGIGTKVTVYENSKIGQAAYVVGHDEVRTEVNYRSKRAPILHFGLKGLTAVDVRVRTRSGKVYDFTNDTQLVINQVNTLAISSEPVRCRKAVPDTWTNVQDPEYVSYLDGQTEKAAAGWQLDPLLNADPENATAVTTPGAIYVAPIDLTTGAFDMANVQTVAGAEPTLLATVANGPEWSLSQHGPELWYAQLPRYEPFYTSLARATLVNGTWTHAVVYVPPAGQGVSQGFSTQDEVDLHPRTLLQYTDSDFSRLGQAAWGQYVPTANPPITAVPLVTSAGRWVPGSHAFAHNGDVNQAEVRIYDTDMLTDTLVTTLPWISNHNAAWVAPETGRAAIVLPAHDALTANQDEYYVLWKQGDGTWTRTGPHHTPRSDIFKCSYSEEAFAFGGHSYVFGYSNAPEAGGVCNKQRDGGIVWVQQLSTTGEPATVAITDGAETGDGYPALADPEALSAGGKAFLYYGFKIPNVSAQPYVCALDLPQ